MEKEVLIIIPAYNEAQAISPVLKELKTLTNAFADILVINDSSADQTSRIVQEEGILVASQVFNLGYGSALQTGYKYAIRYGYQYIIQLDADGQHDPMNVLHIYERLKSDRKPDIVIGSRFLEGSQSFKVSGIKRMTMKYFSFIIQRFGHQKITDPTSGLQGLSRAAFLYYSSFNLFDNQYPDANVLLLMSLLEYQIEEIPAIMYARESGTSMHSGLKPIFYMLVMNLCIFNVILRVKRHKEKRKLNYEKPAM
ncbi:glycosyltransferase family 2 protein [[Eubacterium] hominis]|uniref:glycosyltransferase family 2 protein n=1 Tax=[Eubacterium] hominis TaxID=2764325 RepID=UPI003A4E3A22